MLKRFLSQEWAKLKVMNFTDKRQYIWEYYRYQIFMFGLGVIVLGSLINTWFINPPKQDYLYIAWQAQLVDHSNLDEMGERMEVILDDPGRYRVTVRCYVITGVESPEMILAISNRFSAMVTVGNLSATIISAEGIQEFADFGLLRPPTEVLDILRESDTALYEEISGRLHTVTFTLWDDEDAPPVTDAMAINISGAPILVDLGIDADGLYLGVISNAWNFEGIARALKVMFGTFVVEEYVYAA